MPDEGLSWGKCVPFRAWFSLNPAARTRAVSREATYSLAGLADGDATLQRASGMPAALDHQ